MTDLLIDTYHAVGMPSNYGTYVLILSQAHYAHISLQLP